MVVQKHHLLSSREKRVNSLDKNENKLCFITAWTIFYREKLLKIITIKKQKKVTNGLFKLLKKTTENTWMLANLILRKR